MACGACGSSGRSRARSGPTRTLYQVVLDGGAGRTAFQTHDLTLARNVSRNYPGSVLAPDPDASPETDPTPDTETVEQTTNDETEPATSS
jgi:hypothetical protein